MFQENYQDLQLACCDCGEQFVFSGKDQEFYDQKGFQHPKRCPVCRANRKMGDGGRRQRRSYNVICSACGCETTVPFEPKSDRPVFCSDCYRNNQ